MEYVVGVDIGAGSGTKIGVFDRAGGMAARGLFPVGKYPGQGGLFCDSLAGVIAETAGTCPSSSIVGVGMACPGLFDRNGICRLSNNLPFLVGNDLGRLIGERLDVPAWVINDAAAGGMAEWSVARHELVYWVIGGGWGGAWMAADGGQALPSMGWSGDFSDLHCVNEPGFCIHVHAAELAPILAEHGIGWDDFIAELPDDSFHGSGAEGWFRASAVTSNSIALSRIFHIFARKMSSDASISVRGFLHATANGERFSRLVDGRMEAALESGRFFVDVWAVAIAGFYHIAIRDGLTQDVPVHIAGGLVFAIERFLPRLQQRLAARGLHPTIRVSLCHRQGKRANLLGAAELAWNRLDAISSPGSAHERPQD